MSQFVVEYGNVGRPPEPDGRLDAPAFHRNHEPIWSVLAPFLLGQTGDVLEVGSGTGQHVAEFARRAPNVVWWPSDYSDKHLSSIAAWRKYADLPNIRPPKRIDLARPNWGLDITDSKTLNALTAIFCANVLHIAPWRVAAGLVSGAASRLRAQGRLFVYGPFMRGGRHTAPSNAAFDESLRAENPEWGVRDISDLDALAAGAGLTLIEAVQMPANNLTLIFERGQ